MTNQHTIKAIPADAAMTLDELRKFVDDCERAGLPDGATVKATVTYRGLIKTIEATG
jgi:hypothetical protein